MRTKIPRPPDGGTSTVLVCKLIWVEVRDCGDQEAVEYNTFKAFHYVGSQSNGTVIINWLSEAGFLFLGTGQIVEFFHILGTVQSRRDQVNSLLNTSLSWEAHVFRSLPLILSGPTAFLVFSLRNRDSTTLPSISKSDIVIIPNLCLYPWLIDWLIDCFKSS